VFIGPITAPFSLTSGGSAADHLIHFLAVQDMTHAQAAPRGTAHATRLAPENLFDHIGFIQTESVFGLCAFCNPSLDQAMFSNVFSGVFLSRYYCFPG